MKRTGIIILVIVMLFTLTACDISTSLLDLIAGSPDEETSQPTQVQQPTAAQETTHPTQSTETESTVAPTETEETEPVPAWDPTMYNRIIQRAQAEFDGYLSTCSYLLYDINQDQIPELVLNLGATEETSQYRFYTIIDGEATLLKIVDTIPSVLCGYELGKGMIIYGAYQSSEHISVIKMVNDSLSVELVADHPMGNTHSFAHLPTYALIDPAGLNWESNPTDFNDIALSQLLAEEKIYRENMVDWFTAEQMREINVFLSNFSEQRFQAYPSDEYALLHFVYIYCIINRPNDITYNGYDAYISLESANSILWQYFANSISPNKDYVLYTKYNDFDIIYENGWLKYPLIIGEDYRYVTIVREMTPNGNGTYNVVFDIFEVYATSLDQYYKLRPSEVVNHPEMHWVASGTALLEDYWRNHCIATYHLLKYFEN
jgi:hypothetical protein